MLSKLLEPDPGDTGVGMVVRFIPALTPNLLGAPSYVLTVISRVSSLNHI